MAFNRFGIKEVADVRFYKVGDVQFAEGKLSIVGNAEPVLELDSLKVSTIEMTAEQSEARGGKGNPPLIVWDYGREVNVTLEDALMSMKTFEVMYGAAKNGCIVVSANTFPGNYAVIGRTFARNQEDGEDHLFTFYIPNAKVQSENTITMEAEGDPTVFNMSLRVLRAGRENSDMMYLIPDEEIFAKDVKIWGDLDATVTTKKTYEVVFVDVVGKKTEYLVEEGAATPSETAAEGYKWEPTPAETVTGNVTYKAVASV